MDGSQSPTHNVTLTAHFNPGIWHLSKAKRKREETPVFLMAIYGIYHEDFKTFLEAREKAGGEFKKRDEEKVKFTTEFADYEFDSDEFLD